MINRRFAAAFNFVSVRHSSSRAVASAAMTAMPKIAKATKSREISLVNDSDGVFKERVEVQPTGLGSAGEVMEAPQAVELSWPLIAGSWKPPSVRTPLSHPSPSPKGLIRSMLKAEGSKLLPVYPYIHLHLFTPTGQT